MTAKLIKINPTGLEGAVLAYVKEPNSHGFHDAVLSATSAHNFLKLYLALKGVEDGIQSNGLLCFLEELQGSEQEVISVRTALEDIHDVAEKYGCDIIEIHIPKPKAHCMPVPMQKNIQEMYEAECMKELDFALTEYFEAYWKKCFGKPEPYITYSDCTKEEWRHIFSELHGCLVDPSSDEDYDMLENDLVQLCTGLQLPEKLIPEMCAIARSKQSNWKEKLNLYKGLIFALEDEAYEAAAKIRNKIQKCS